MIEFTVKQIAELLSVSKPTVQKAIKELAIEPERAQNNNRRYYSYADTVAIIKAVNPSYDFSLLSEFGAKPQSETAKPQTEPPKTENQTAKPQTEPPNQDEKTAKPPSSAEVELLKSMLGVIQEQLKEKDKQLAIKDKQIQDLSDRLAEAMQLTRGQQYIAAADKTTELLEADTKRGQQEEQPIVVSEAAAAENPAPSADNTEREAAETPEPQQKKSFWQRIFGR